MTVTHAWHEAPVNDSEIPRREDFEHLLFARGYLLGPKPMPSPAPHWRSKQVGSWYLSWDPRLAASFVERDDRTLLLLGNAINLRRRTNGSAVALEVLEAWSRSRRELDDALEWLAGRYVVLGQGPDGHFFQTDATGMLSASYSAKHRVIASHQNLVAEALGGLPSSHLKDPLPGLSTRFADVRLLTANTELDPRDFSVRRVGPRPITAVRDPREVAVEVLDLMKRQFSFLHRDGGGPMVSLTAGLDSRITLAAMHDLAAESLYFTYEKRFNGVADDSAVDHRVAAQLAGQLNLKHHSYTLHTMDIDAQLRDVLRRNTTHTHNRAIAASYLHELPVDRLHVRSNLYEIARGYYRNKERPSIDAHVFARILTASVNPPQRIVDEFEEMVSVTGILDVDGYDPLDLFYWEHRMSNWFHKVLLESDIAHDTHILVNSRAILRLMLSVPASDRRSALVFDHLVGLAWPAAYKLPINGVARQLPPGY